LNSRVSLTIGESSLGDLYLEGHRVVPPGVFDDELVLPVLRRRDFHRKRIPPVLITFALVCFALIQNAQAVDPAPDGGYPGGNTAEGQSALLNLTSGGGDVAAAALESAITLPAAS
jgi:hypothetical protein